MVKTCGHCLHYVDSKTMRRVKGEEAVEGSGDRGYGSDLMNINRKVHLSSFKTLNNFHVNCPILNFDSLRGYFRA